MWHDWFSRNEEVEAAFDGQWGHTYRFRARAWQRYANGAHLYGPYEPQGGASTFVGEAQHRVYVPLATRSR